MNTYINSAKLALSGVFGVVLIHVLWVLAHWSSSRIYPYFCAPDGFFGLLLSPFVSQAPHCVALFWITETSRRCIRDMWFAIGTYISCHSVSLLYTQKASDVTRKYSPPASIAVSSPREESEKSEESRENMFVKFWKKRVEQSAIPATVSDAENDSEQEKEHED